ncbi:AAA family ATPase [Sediminibacillus sp. JSM 1682029]|uniref:AAA family ATPase n=1 Tax=Sediminibacillus sp. JSM 1682029 TaxID=3229857 RepID=UPI0035250BB5
MKLKIEKLTLTCRKEIVKIPFATNLTYFYGKMGAGKSTILQLIDYCLGNELIVTPALQQEFISAELKLVLGNNQVTLFREKGSNQVQVEWADLQKQVVLNVIAPTYKQENAQPLVPNTNIILLTDLLFYLGGFHAPLVRKSKRTENTELIRLSFRDLMWFCYLNQDEIDSSLFHLEREANNFKRLKSRDVMRLILGYHQESVALLENELLEVRNEKTTLYSTAKQLQVFLEENQIGETSTIIGRIEEIDKNINQVKNNINNINQELKQEKTTHPVDKLREEARSYAILLDELNTSIYDIEVQIAQRKRLLGEFASAKMKVNRSLIARNTLKDLSFFSCPQCERELINKVPNNNHCSLCKVPFDDQNNFESNNIEVIKTDLTSRYNELQDSITRLNRQRDAIVKELHRVKEEKQVIDKDLVEFQSTYDSIYLAKAKDYERTLGQLRAEKVALNKLLPLTNQVKELHDKADNLSGEEERLKRELKEARENAEKDNSNLEELKSLFLENLVEVGLPGVNHNNIVTISTKDFIPKIYREKDDDVYEMQFSNLGSGGKKTIFKCCFALAIHRLAKQRKVPLPTFLMIDTPMKNISERENADIFKGFYSFIYQLAENELKDLQFIIVDKEYYTFPEDFSKKVNTITKHMTPDDPLHPPLIPYYKGH